MAIIMFWSVNPLESQASGKADEIVSNAHNYLGTPYRFGGTTPSGFDCSGYLRHVFAQSGVDLPRTTSQQFQVGTPVSRGDLKKGDLVFFNTSGRGVSHSGIYIGGNRFIHASTSRGVIVTNLSDPYYWGSRYIGARRVLPEEQPKQEEPQEVKVKEEKVEPTVEFSRADMAKILADELGLEAAEAATFEDVDQDSDVSLSIAAVANKGIITGFNDKEFRPDGEVTRAQVAALFVRAYELEAADESEVPFDDISDSHWAFENIQNLVSNGIINGYPDGTYKPDRAVSEEEFHIIIDRINDMD